MIALVTVWSAIACSYQFNWPVGFFVGVFSAGWYGVGRLYVATLRWQRRRAPMATS